MKISINWLKDFVNLDGISNEELIKRLTLSTAEIEEVIEYGANLKDVVVGEIVEAVKHPNSDKLSVLKVNVGSQVLQIVCGAPNCKTEMRVAVVLPGGMVDGYKISVAKLAGVESHGMCLSEKELGISDNHEGIIELPKTFEIGKNLKELLPIEDTVFEIDNKSLTNRPDLWCHYGFAREVSAIFGRELKPLKLENLENFKGLKKLNIEIKDSEKCFRYSGLKLENVTKKQSPIEMRIRLYYAGMRALNLLADLTNYVMLEVGQPMHAFDANKINNIIVKTAGNELEFETLDGEKRNIDKDTLLICDNDKPVAIAGIMGGLDSEVEPDTTSIVLESANFYATSIRVSAGKLALRTEASMRYEKSLDPELTILVVERFVQLLKQIDKNIVVASSLTDVYKHKYETIIINTTKQYIESYCGIEISTSKIANILKSLGFKIKTKGDNLEVTVPSYRATKDVSIPADLVEEVARVYGYDNIEYKTVEGKIRPVTQETGYMLEYETKKVLAEKFGLNEIHTYIWNDKIANRELNINSQGQIKVLNSTIKENDEIRSQLMPSLLKVVNENKNLVSEMDIFEIARVVNGVDSKGKAKEQKKLSIVLASKTKTANELYFNLKVIVEFIVKTFKNTKVIFDIKHKADNNLLHPVNSVNIMLSKNIVGQMGILHPAINFKIDKKLMVAGLEIDFNKFVELNSEKETIKELSKYQSTTLDFNFLVDKNACYFDLETIFANYKTDLKYTFKLKDVFEDEKLLGNKKSYTFSFELVADDHTLTSNEIEAFHNGLINYAKNYNLELRDI